MSNDRAELKRIFNEQLKTICFDEYIDKRLAGDFIFKLMPLIRKKLCSYRVERRTNPQSGHLWLEVISSCGESFEFENDAYKYFEFCPYCGGKMKE